MLYPSSLISVPKTFLLNKSFGVSSQWTWYIDLNRALCRLTKRLSCSCCCRLDLYMPTSTAESKPVVAFVTGGAWIIGWVKVCIIFYSNHFFFVIYSYSSKVWIFFFDNGTVGEAPTARNLSLKKITKKNLYRGKRETKTKQRKKLFGLILFQIVLHLLFW